MSTEANIPLSPRSRLRHRATRSMTAVGAVAFVGLVAAACGSSTPGASNSTTTTAASPAGTTGTSSASDTVVANTVSNAKIGSPILVNSSGMTLYKFSSDTSSMSACTGACATAWPPLTVPSGTTPKGGPGATGTFGTLTRSDGTVQVTYNGSPLYTFSGDTSAGSTSGENLKSDGGTWTVVTIGSSTSTSKTTTAPPPATTNAPPPTTTTTAASGGYGY